jgi:hypothetical protein
MGDAEGTKGVESGWHREINFPEGGIPLPRKRGV